MEFSYSGGKVSGTSWSLTASDTGPGSAYASATIEWGSGGDVVFTITHQNNNHLDASYNDSPWYVGGSPSGIATYSFSGSSSLNGALSYSGSLPFQLMASAGASGTTSSSTDSITGTLSLTLNGVTRNYSVYLTADASSQM